ARRLRRRPLGAPAAAPGRQPVSRSHVHHARDARGRRLCEPAWRGRRRAGAERDLLLLLGGDEHGRHLRLAPDSPDRDGPDRARRPDGGGSHPAAEWHHRRSRVLPATAAAPRGRPRESEGNHMRFSIYSELQSWPGKPYDRLYGEVLEQIENADRLGYD